LCGAGVVAGLFGFFPIAHHMQGGYFVDFYEEYPSTGLCGKLSYRYTPFTLSPADAMAT
jgi:hypothetical protein